MTVTEARFRPATAEEVAYARGNFAWKSVNSPWNFSMKILGTYNLWKHSFNIVETSIPKPLQVAHNIKWYCGLAPEMAFMRCLPTFKGTWNIIDSEIKVMEAFFEHNRDSAIFAHGAAFFAMLDLIKQAFPETQFTNEDFMFTCSAEKNQKYHRLIQRLVSGNLLRNNSEFIKKRVKETLADWARRTKTEKEVNVSVESKIFASEIISQLVFGMTKRNEQVAQAVNFINKLIVKQVLGKLTKEDYIQLGKSLMAFNIAVNDVLNSGQPVPLFEEAEEPLTIAEKKAMVFAIFFAGQETVGALLTHMLKKISRLKNDQLKIKSDEIQQIFVQAIKEFTPAHGVSRILKVDTCLDFKTVGKNGEEILHKHIFYAGERVTVMMMDFAQKAKVDDGLKAWKPFGAGAHLCPGESLARMEFCELISEVIKNYYVYPGPHDVAHNSPAGYVTLQYKHDVWLCFDERYGEESKITLS